VVSRRAAAGICRALAGPDELAGGESDVDRSADGLPASRADQRHRVETERAGASPGRCRHERIDVLDQAGMGKHVGHDSVLAGVVGQAGSHPVGPGGAEKLVERFVVDCEEMLVRVWFGGHEPGSGILEHATDRLGTGVDLGAGSSHPDPDLAAGLVEPMPIAPDDDGELH
jgi:hypothetical protein